MIGEADSSPETCAKGRDAPGMKRVLCITYHYPPDNSSASRRSGGMAKYLPQFGWWPLVVTHLWTPTNCVYDPEFVRNLPPDRLLAAMPGGSSTGSSSERVRILGRTVPRLRWMLRPHQYPWDWTRRAEKTLDRFLRDHTVDAIWATDPPHGASYVATRIGRRFGIPMVADYRDVFGELDGEVEVIRRIWRWRRKLLESKIISHARTVTTVTAGLAETILKRYGAEAVVIPNGFDPEDLAKSASPVISKFRIAYTGSVSPLASPRLVLAAVERLVSEKKLAEEDVVLEFYGWCPEPFRKSLLREFGHRDYVRFLPRVSSEACSAICRSSAVLLLPGYVAHKGIMGGKVFEYLAARRPILCAPSDLDCMAALIEQTGTGANCSTVDETMRQLLRWYREWQTTGTVRCRGNTEAILKKLDG